MNLEDKILGEKLHYYCSSSDEDEGPGESKGVPGNSKESNQCSAGTLSNNVNHFSSSAAAGSNNTGPKGFIF